MSYQDQVKDSYKYAKRQMWNARSKYERGTWLILFDWCKKELEKRKLTPAATEVSKV